jgi:hypothetical protein
MRQADNEILTRLGPGTPAGELLRRYWHRPDLAKETLEEKWAKWKRCMAAIEQLRHMLEAWKPDVLVIVADDQNENIVDNANPPFTIFIGETCEASTSLGYFNEPKSENRTKYAADHRLSQELLEAMMDAGFDPAYSKELPYEGGLGHAFARVLKFLTPAVGLPVVPIMVNTYFPPAPSSKRCVAFGKALAGAIRKATGKSKVAIIGSGGLSHTLIDEALDERVLRSHITWPDATRAAGATIASRPTKAIISRTWPRSSTTTPAFTLQRRWSCCSRSWPPDAACSVRKARAPDHPSIHGPAWRWTISSP